MDMTQGVALPKQTPKVAALVTSLKQQILEATKRGPLSGPLVSICERNSDPLPGSGVLGCNLAVERGEVFSEGEQDTIQGAIRLWLQRELHLKTRTEHEKVVLPDGSTFAAVCLSVEYPKVDPSRSEAGQNNEEFIPQADHTSDTDASRSWGALAVDFPSLAGMVAPTFRGGVPPRQKWEE